MAPSLVTVVIPGEDTSLRVLRLVASDVGRLLDFGYDKVEDARLAVNEAASILLGAGCRRISCRLSADDGALSVEVGGEPEPTTGLRPSSLGQMVLSRVAEGVVLGPPISFTISA